ncbi:MAG TPA: SGNH/GDSL hydrolase family protein [Casimicrobiaceae bacterium]|nr:SGNH/GDSL hydrolase family protein [Casimicrobiaceae bacterium]
MDDAVAVRPFSIVDLGHKLVGRAVVYALFPVLLSQAFALRRHALTLVPAAGPGAGRIGRGEPLHFLAIGDSIIAGVGARRVERSTVVHVARFMSGRLDREINWHASGMIGAGARRVRRDVVPQLPPQAFDVILLSVGVNDVLKLERKGRFRRQLLKLIRELRRHSPHAVIAFLGLPPLDEFPKLRRPLRWLVGHRVRHFDAVAREALTRVPNAMHIPVRFSPRPDMFAGDGLHPSETSQRRLAKIIAGALTPSFSGSTPAVARHARHADDPERGLIV